MTATMPQKPAGSAPAAMPPAVPVAVVGLSAVAWGLWWLPLRALADLGLSGMAASTALYAASLVIALPWLWWRWAAVRRAGWLLPVASGLFAVTLLSWNLALIYGEVVRVTLLFYLSPVWSVLISWLAMGQGIGPRRVAAVLLGIGGAVVLLGIEDGLPLPESFGDWMGFGAGISFALSMTATRLGTRIEGHDHTALALPLTFLLALALLPFDPALAMPADPVPAFAWAALAALVWMVPNTATLLWGGRHLDPTPMSLLLLLEVAAASLSAALLTDEPFGLREAAGCVLILAAGVVETLRRGPKPLLDDHQGSSAPS